MLAKAKKIMGMGWRFLQYVGRNGCSAGIQKLKSHALWQRRSLIGIDNIRQERAFFNPFELVYQYARQSDAENLQSILACKQVAIGCASGGNFFMHEISKLLSCAFHEMGIEVIHFNENQVVEAVNADLTIVVAPHEFFILGDGSALLDKLAMAKKLVMLNTEQAQTQWFANALPYLEHADCIWDMNYQSAVLLRANHLPAYFLPLGYSLNYQTKLASTQALRRSLPLMSLSQAVTSTIEDQDYSKRPIDVLFVGTISDKRRQFFAQHAGCFAAFECFFYLPEGNQPFNENEDRTLDFQQLAGLARRSKILINIHRDTANYLEWQRIVNLGVFCGTLVISETCDSSPALVPGLDYIDVPLEFLAQTCNHYLSDPKAAQAFVERATAHLTSQQKLSKTLTFLLTDMMREVK